MIWYPKAYKVLLCDGKVSAWWYGIPKLTKFFEFTQLPLPKANIKSLWIKVFLWYFSWKSSIMYWTMFQVVPWSYQKSNLWRGTWLLQNTDLCIMYMIMIHMTTDLIVTKHWFMYNIYHNILIVKIYKALINNTYFEVNFCHSD